MEGVHVTQHTRMYSNYQNSEKAYTNYTGKEMFSIELQLA